MHRVRKCLPVLAGAIFVATLWGCGNIRKRCAGANDPRPPDSPSACGAGESCLWVHDGDRSGYFCVATCSEERACPDGASCRAGGASSCATCMDLLDICE
jgi:hypothetical protein